MKNLQIVLILVLLCSTWALYDEKSKVVKLTAENFKQLVLQSTDLWLVEFYAPWAAKALDGVVKLGAVDMTTDESVGSPYNIQGYPTLKFFGTDKEDPSDYSGERKSQDIIDFGFEEKRNAADEKIGEKKNKKEQKEQKEQKKQESAGPEDKDVVVLTDAEFDEKVLNSEDGWLIEFYAPWCGHCKNLAPHWNKLATELKDSLPQIKIAKLDATVHPKSAQKYGVKGYPTIKYFKPGKRVGDGSPIDFDGGRDQASISEWLKVRLGLIKEFSVDELVSQQQYNDECAEYKGICLFVFLPHILDSSAEERNKYVKLVLEIGKTHKAKPIKYFWSQGGDQLAFEDSFRVGGAGYPSTLAFNAVKNVFTILRGALNEKNLETFVKAIVSNKVGFEQYKSQVKLKTIEAWDGQDQRIESSDSADSTLNEDL